MGRYLPCFPTPEVLRGASREQLLDLLDVIDQLQEKQVPVPDSYLFVVSGELMRAEAERVEQGPPKG